MDRQHIKKLFVTLSDSLYLSQTKALFSAVYWKSGWTGDYMLLAHDIPEKDLQWFKDRKIQIYRCTPLLNTAIGHYPPVVMDKLYLFTPQFKKWDVVIYLDTDIIVRASLDELTKVQGFAAVKDMGDYKINFNIQKNHPELYHELSSTYDLEKVGFNSGVIAYNTRIIDGNSTFEELTRLLHKYRLILNGDQPLFNLYFQNWEPLPHLYNFTIANSSKVYRDMLKKNPKGLFHFGGYYKPWYKANFIYDEWSENLRKAELIDLSLPKHPLYPITKDDIQVFENSYKELREIINLKIELLNLYRWDRKLFRKKLFSKTVRKNLLMFKQEFLRYYPSSFLPAKLKSAAKSLLAITNMLPTDSDILRKRQKRAID
jgi:lipopolysaccharide biosynthesis glycosyltransferase